MYAGLDQMQSKDRTELSGKLLLCKSMIFPCSISRFPFSHSVLLGLFPRVGFLSRMIRGKSFIDLLSVPHF